MFNVLHYKELHPVIEFFEQYVNSIFRFRMSTLQPTSFIEEHGNHMYPRIHIPLNETDFSFYINDEKVEEGQNVTASYSFTVTQLHDRVKINCAAENGVLPFPVFSEPHMLTIKRK